MCVYGGGYIFISLPCVGKKAFTHKSVSMIFIYYQLFACRPNMAQGQNLMRASNSRANGYTRLPIRNTIKVVFQDRSNLEKYDYTYCITLAFLRVMGRCCLENGSLVIRYQMYY